MRDFLSVQARSILSTKKYSFAFYRSFLYNEDPNLDISGTSLSLV